eukprot:31419-Pelagococcus_subviridis.AAC.11
MFRALMRLRATGARAALLSIHSLFLSARVRLARNASARARRRTSRARGDASTDSFFFSSSRHLARAEEKENARPLSPVALITTVRASQAPSRDAEPRAPGRERRIRRGHRAQERRRDGVQRASKRDGRSRDRPRGSIESARSTTTKIILSKPRLAFKRATTDRPTYRTRDRSQKLTAGDLLLQKTLDQRGHWLWVDVNSSALEAVQRMTRANVGALLVMRERVLDVDDDGVVTREEASRRVFFVLVFGFCFFVFFRRRRRRERER